MVMTCLVFAFHSIHRSVLTLSREVKEDENDGMEAILAHT